MHYSVWFTRFGLVLMLSLVSISIYASKRTKNISYIPANSSVETDPERHLLDVYAPSKKPKTPLPVVVFIHGGNWDSGSKNIYWFIGRRLAKQDVVAVIINYRLSPNVLVPAMADDCARAVKWTAQHIGEYGGDPNQIFVMGHSAGGGLAALLATDDALFTQIGMAKNPVKGAILNDAAGINMYDYLLKMEYPGDQKYLVSFGKDPVVWKDMSALFKVKPGMPPMLLYAGERTYPSIAKATKELADTLQSLGIRHQYKVLPGKKHVPMVTQLFWKRNVIYRDLLELIRG